VSASCGFWRKNIIIFLCRFDDPRSVCYTILKHRNRHSPNKIFIFVSYIPIFIGALRPCACPALRPSANSSPRGAGPGTSRRPPLGPFASRRPSSPGHPGVRPVAFTTHPSRASSTLGIHHLVLMVFNERNNRIVACKFGGPSFLKLYHWNLQILCSIY